MIRKNNKYGRSFLHPKKRSFVRSLPLSSPLLRRQSLEHEHANDRDTRFTRRSLLLGVGGLGLFGLLTRKLYNLQNIEGRKYKSLAEDNRTATRFTPAVRGKIYDRTHRLIATNEESLRVLLIPDKAEDITASLEQLAAIIAISSRQKKWVLATARRQNPQIAILVAQGISWGQFSRINVLGARIGGIYTDIGWKRRYPEGENFAHILGHLGQPTKLQLVETPALRLPGSKIGVSGIEQGFDAVLRGRFGHKQLEVDARGRRLKELTVTPAKNGTDITLTIDHVLQKNIQKRLSSYRRAAVVAINVENGDVVAMCSTPTFDPNDLTPPIDEKKWQKLKSDPDHPLNDKATRGQYPPGSTFKMITALAGLEAGIITPKSRFKCKGHMKWHKQKFHCWNRSGHGYVRLHKALKQSCDVYFYETARLLGIERLAGMARRLGLGQTYDCGLPGQKSGIIPDPDWKQLEKRRVWFGGETVLAGIGQGYVLATPLQLAVMTARLATGKKVEPRFAHLQDEENHPLPPDLELDKTALSLIRNAMAGVVNESDGTAPQARLDWPGLQMAGKTGTSQVRGHRGRRKRNSELQWKYRDHALFVAFAPVEKPRYALSVIIEHGESGGRVAGPLARDIMKTLLIRDPAYTRPNPGEQNPDAGEVLDASPPVTGESDL